MSAVRGGVAVCVCAIVAACGSGGATVSAPAASGDPPPAGISFRIDGTFVAVSGGQDVTITSSPGFSGRTGCDSHHFIADLFSDTHMLFGYTASGALLDIGDDLYTFDEPPKVEGGALLWSHDFDAGAGAPAHSITVKVGCPRPSS